MDQTLHDIFIICVTVVGCALLMLAGMGIGTLWFYLEDRQATQQPATSTTSLQTPTTPAPSSQPDTSGDASSSQSESSGDSTLCGSETSKDNNSRKVQEVAQLLRSFIVEPEARFSWTAAETRAQEHVNKNLDDMAGLLETFRNLLDRGALEDHKKRFNRLK